MALRSIELPGAVSKDGYVHLLTTIRAIGATERKGYLLDIAVLLMRNCQKNTNTSWLKESGLRFITTLE
jgi:hypothetical protein